MLPHTYEEIRNTVVEIILGRKRVSFEPYQYQHLVSGVAEVLSPRNQSDVWPSSAPRLADSDAELVRDVFWDLFRQGYITLGVNNSNPNWPFFRLSHFGSKTLDTASPYRFHDTSSYLRLIQDAVPDISSEALMYLDEAASSFYAGCLLSSCVMIGVAAESEFLRLVETATTSSKYAANFSPLKKDAFVRKKISIFQAALKPILSELEPRKDFEDLETNLSLIQSVLRITRNEAGHPTSSTPPLREQVYIYLQLFLPFARQLERLRTVLQ